MKFLNFKPRPNIRFCSNAYSSIRTLLNHKLKIYRRITIRIWFLLLILILFISLTIAQLFKEKPIDFNKFNLLKYDEKYNSKNLHQFPMSKRPISSQLDSVFQSGCKDVTYEMKKPRANAAFVVLARNSEVDGVVESMKSLERHFNQWFNYPWIFLNNEPFTREFKEKVSKISSGEVEFGFIPSKRWDFPDEEKNPVYFNEAVESQGDREIMYGNMPSYHKMCRFYSGYFFQHPLVQKLEWYWRVEPDVEFYCDLTYDPFLEMEKHGKVYGFTVVIKELLNTVPNLFRYTKSFIKENKVNVPDSWNLFIDDLKFYKGANSDHYSGVRDKDEFWYKLQERTPMNRALSFVAKSSNDLDQLDQHSINKLIDHSNKRGLRLANKDQFEDTEFNLCHFWSNFEIARTDLFLSPEYEAYFSFLENSKGFYSERWGDAPIHSLAAGMFLNLSQIHYFRDVGYKHSTIGHCPSNSPFQLPYKSSDAYRKTYTETEEEYWSEIDEVQDDGNIATGCRCRCPGDHREIENTGGSCINVWASILDDEKPAEKYLDLDNIEMKAVQMYEDYLITHGDENGKGWSLSEDDIKILEKMLIL